MHKNAGFDRSITEGPIGKAVWKLAWPTMLQNMIAGLQGVIDHTMVGHYVGFQGNAAIGVSWQIFLVVVVFISSLYAGMAVLVARFAGANDAYNVNRTVYQGLLMSLIIGLGVLAPAGYFLSPVLLDFVKAAPDVQAEALPYLRVMFLFSVGKLLFFLLGGALRAAGDAKTPLQLGIALTVLNLLANVVLIPGYGPIPKLGTFGAGVGTVLASVLVSGYGLYLLFAKKLIVKFSREFKLSLDFSVISELFRFGLPAGFQGIAVNIGGALLLRYVGSVEQSAEAQAAYTVCYTQLFSLITWTSVGLMGATASVAGQNLGAQKPERTRDAVFKAVRMGLLLSGSVGFLFWFFPQVLLSIFGMEDQIVLHIGEQLLQYLSISGLFVSMALCFTGGLQGTGDTRSPLVISLISQVAIPITICGVAEAMDALKPHIIWTAIVAGHISRATLSFLRFRQGHWESIKVELR